MSSSTTTPAIGLLCAIISAIFNGSFTVPFKAAAAANKRTTASIDDGVAGAQNDGNREGNNEVHPIVFTLYVSLGVFLSSMIFIVPFLTITISINLPSLIAGFLFVLGVSASFLAISIIGMALSQGIWAGSATVVSYLWGTLIFGEQPAHPRWSVLGLILLVVGVVGIAFCKDIGQNIRVMRILSDWNRLLFSRRFGGASEELIPLDSTTVNGSTSTSFISEKGTNDSFQNDRDTVGSTSNAPTAAAYASGVFWACAVGLFGGSILAPTHYLQPDEQGLAVLPSFGIGCVILAPIVLVVNNFWTKETPPFNVRQALLPGLFSGLLWNISNLLSLIAIPSIGYGVAYPLLQGAVLVSGLWGIIVFREISNRRTITAFWIAGGILLSGAAILAASQ